MANTSRPLSPHLQVYRWKLHMALSILHRATGVALGFGTLLIAWWILATAAGPDAYNAFITLAGGIIGRLVLFGFTFALMLHLLNGIRHLFWDAGYGFELDTVQKSGVAVVVLAVVFTAAIWVGGYYVAGKI